MKKISLHNYEAFLLDYFEGNLDERSRAELFVFADSHPELGIDLMDEYLPALDLEELRMGNLQDLRRDGENLLAERVLSAMDGSPVSGLLPEEMQAYEKTRLHAETVIFDAKEELIREVANPDQSYPLLAYFENSTGDQDRKSFEKKMAEDPSMQADLTLLYKTKLQPDLRIKFPGKRSLKKQGRVLALFRSITDLRVAAAIIFLCCLTLVLNYFTNTGAPVLQSRKTLAKVAGTSIVPRTPANADEPATEAPAFTASSKSINKVIPSDTSGETHKERVTSPESPGPTSVASKEEDVLKDPLMQKNTEQNSETLLAEINRNGDSLTAQTAETVNDYSILAIGEDEDLLGGGNQQDAGFWKKAVRLARQVNKMGVKSVDGVEEGSSKFRLSFNSFVVEKH